MKKIALSILCLLLFFSGTFPMNEESWDEESAKFSQPTTWKKKVKLVILGILTGAAVLNATTMAKSINDGNSSIIVLPYNATLPSSNETCSFQYGTPCYETPDGKNNFNVCCSAAENLKECIEWCKKDSNEKKGCMILRKCKGKTTYDPQFVGSAAALVLTLIAEFGVIFWG